MGYIGVYNPLTLTFYFLTSCYKYIQVVRTKIIHLRDL